MKEKKGCTRFAIIVNTNCVMSDSAAVGGHEALN
jgi:hypothetical protein